MHDTGDLSAAPRRGARRWKDEPAAHPIGDRNDHHVSRLDGSAHSAAPQKHRLHPWLSGQRSPSQAHDHGIDTSQTNSRTHLNLVIFIEKGSLPLMLTFDLREEAEPDPATVAKIQEKYDVIISIKPKPKLSVKSVNIRGYERNAGQFIHFI